MGMTASGVLVRRNTKANAKFNEAWWTEVNNGSVRDQLSFGYVSWKLDFVYEQMPFLRGCSIRKHDSKVKPRVSA